MIKKNNITVNVWGRELNLNIIFDQYKGEEITPVQEKAYNSFVKNAEKLINGVKSDVEKYCLDQNKDEIGEKVDNIFKYVKPKSLFIKRSKNNDRIVALMCSYKFDPDHGRAIIFKNEKFVNIDKDDSIL